MWRKPNRPKNEISQTFNDGVLTVYSVDVGVVPDYETLKGLTKKSVLHYSERRMGVQRYYAGIQAQTKIDKVLRCQDAGLVEPHDVVITESGKHYLVQLVQSCYDVYPPSVDVSLAAIVQQYVSAMLISRTYTGGGWKETSREVKCSVHAVDVKEFYAANSENFRPELTIVLPDHRDYHDETLVDYNGRRYRVLRASRSEQQITLTLEKAPYEDGVQDVKDVNISC